jgi:L-lactate dehydrogenase complex protein LldF
MLTGVEENPSLPYASTLCGACFDACPVRIDIPSILVHLRNRVTESKSGVSPEALTMAAASWVMASPARFAVAERSSRIARLWARRRGRLSTLPPPLSAWTRSRDLPLPPRETFRQWWRRTRGAR